MLQFPNQSKSMQRARVANQYFGTSLYVLNQSGITDNSGITKPGKKTILGLMNGASLVMIGKIQDFFEDPDIFSLQTYSRAVFYAMRLARVS